MKAMKYRMAGKWAIYVTAAIIALTSCKKKDDDPKPEEVAETKKTSYTLNSKDVLGVSGTVTFTQKSATETIVDIVLTGVSSGTHPAHIHANSALETGGIVIGLNSVDQTGKSSTVITKKDNGDPISYDQLINFDGYVNVHESLLGTDLMAQGDIGGNVLTGDSKTYSLNTTGDLGVSGSFKIEKRKNGNTLATVTLTGTVNGGSYPAHIHTGSVTTLTKDVVVKLDNVEGVTGGDARSYTAIRKKEDNAAITYDELLKYTGYVDVHKSNLDDTIIAIGNIGSNQP